MAQLRQSMVNLLADWLMRAQAFSPPATWYVGLLSAAASRASAGTEITVAGGYTGYARQGVACSLANWSGTQGDGTTAVSSGSNDYVSNNVAISFSGSLAVPWNGIVGFALWDASAAGNQRLFGVITDSLGNPITRSWAAGDAVAFAPGTLRLYFR